MPRIHRTMHQIALICIQISVFLYFILQFIFHIKNIIASLSDYFFIKDFTKSSFPTNDVRKGGSRDEELRTCERKF